MTAAGWVFLAVLVLVAAASVWLLEQTPDTDDSPESPDTGADERATTIGDIA